MRIAQVLPASTGGIGRHVASLVPRLTAAGHQVAVYAPRGGADGHHDPGTRRLARLVVDGADVVHAHGYRAGAWAAAGLLRPVPVVVTWHNAVLGAGPAALAARGLQRSVARSADLTLGASTDLVDLASRLGARSARLGPVAAPRLPPPTRDRAVVRAALAVEPEHILVLTVGRLAAQKNLDLVLDVAARLRGHCAVVFAIAGEGPERARLAGRIAEERLPVRLLGPRRDIADLLASADLALLTSTWEARALVAQEALIAGLPLVATRVGGIEELVADAALLVGSGEAEEAARAVTRLAEDPQLRQALSQAGQIRARTWPDEDAVAAEVLAAYAEVTSKFRRQARRLPRGRPGRLR